MDIAAVKLVSVAVIFLAGMAGGFLSGRMAGGRKSARLLSLGNAFAGGVFLGAGLMHMLPDAQKGFQAIAGGSDYPWFALICVAGFLLIFFLERVFLHPAHGTSVQKQAGHLLYPYALMFVLSIHSVIAGIALGAEDRMLPAVMILVAVVAHKGTAAFALGVSLLRREGANGSLLHVIGFFSMMTPMGVALGYLFSLGLTGTAEQRFEAVFDALAAGTFLYIAILDILNDEFAAPGDFAAKYALVLAGFGLMALVAIWM